MRMALTGLVARHSLALAAVSAQAQNGTPETEDGRYSFHRVDDGYLRLERAPARFRCAPAARSAGPAMRFRTSARRWKARSRDCRARTPR